MEKSKFIAMTTGKNSYEIFDSRELAEKYAYNQKEEKVMICQILKEIDNTNYPTLREYINKNSRGAYHHFLFRVYCTDIYVISVDDFEKIYNKDILDKYYVIDDKKESNDGDCTNYYCNHNLILKEKEGN